MPIHCTPPIAKNTPAPHNAIVFGLITLHMTWPARIASKVQNTWPMIPPRSVAVRCEPVVESVIMESWERSPSSERNEVRNVRKKRGNNVILTGEMECFSVDSSISGSASCHASYAICIPTPTNMILDNTCNMHGDKSIKDEVYNVINVVSIAKTATARLVPSSIINDCAFVWACNENNSVAINVRSPNSDKNTHKNDCRKEGVKDDISAGMAGKIGSESEVVGESRSDVSVGKVASVELYICFDRKGAGKLMMSSSYEKGYKAVNTVSREIRVQ